MSYQFYKDLRLSDENKKINKLLGYDHIIS